MFYKWPFGTEMILGFSRNTPLITVLYKVVLSFEPADEILKCDHSSESH